MWTPPKDQVNSEPWVPPSDAVVSYQQPEMGGSPPLSYVAKQVAGMLPQVKAIKSAMESPESLLPVAGAAIGTEIAPGPGTALGAGLGQIGGRMIQIAKGSPVKSPGQEAIAPMAQAFVGGVPEVSGIVNPGTTTIAQKIGKGLAKAGETLSGAKQDILQQTARQGLSTYQAPSIPKAQAIFGEALGPEGQVAVKQTAEQAFDPALGEARKTATEIGTKLDNFLAGSGEPPTAIEALKARQATDRVISSTPIWDRSKRQALFDYRNKFDSLMESLNGPLKEASNLYRQAIVKDTILNPTRLTKSGQPSAFLPLLLGTTGIGGYGAGHGGKTAEGILGGLAATSPAVWGLGAATLGSISPVARQAALAAFVDKLTTRENSQ